MNLVIPTSTIAIVGGAIGSAVGIYWSGLGFFAAAIGGLISLTVLRRVFGRGANA